MCEKKNIVIITSGYFPVPPVKGGAIESLVQEIVEENDADKLNLSIISVYDKGAEEYSERYKNVVFEYIKIPKCILLWDKLLYKILKVIFKNKKHMSFRYIFQRIYYIKNTAKLLKNNSYDDIVFENHPTLLGSLRYYGNYKKYYGHYYYHAHNEIKRCFFEKKYLINVSKYICVSNYIKKTIEHKLPEVEENRFCILRNRINEKRFRSTSEEDIKEFRKKYGILCDKKIITFTGRLNPEKGVKELLLAYSEDKLFDCQLVIAGSYYFGSGMKSKYEEELTSIAENIAGDIVFTGNIDYSDMPLLYACSDIIVLPSIWNDPAPLTVIESLTCGKPLITTNVGGIPEYANEKNSIILDVNEKLIENLAIALKNTINDNILLGTLSKNAMENSHEWTQNNYYLDFEKIFMA